MGNMNLLQVLVYLDDLIVFGRSLEEHEEHLLWVLDREVSVLSAKSGTYCVR